MIRSALACVCAAGLLAASVSEAQVAYPAHGQSPARQQKDEAECSAWATKQSGYDPARPPPTATAQPAPVTGSGARVRGAAIGAAVGGISGGDAGKGALAGAAVGGVTRRIQNRRAADQANQANAQYHQGAYNSWRQARVACLKGHGYTMN